jgi:hypothetical protein
MTEPVSVEGAPASIFIELQWDDGASPLWTSGFAFIECPDSLLWQAPVAHAPPLATLAQHGIEQAGSEERAFKGAIPVKSASVSAPARIILAMDVCLRRTARKRECT